MEVESLWISAWKKHISFGHKFDCVEGVRQGWGLSKPTCVFVEIQFIKNFSNLFLWKRNNCLIVISNDILTRQTCGNARAGVSGSKRQALAFYFSLRILYVFLLSICKGDWDLFWLMLRSVCEFGTCKENAAAQCRLAMNFAAKHVCKSEVGIAQPHSLCMYRSHAQT